MTSTCSKKAHHLRQGKNSRLTFEDKKATKAVIEYQLPGDHEPIRLRRNGNKQKQTNETVCISPPDTAAKFLHIRREDSEGTKSTGSL
jgi:hypothetical protein